MQEHMQDGVSISWKMMIVMYILTETHTWITRICPVQ